MKITLLCFLLLLAAATCFLVSEIQVGPKQKCCVSCALPTIKYYAMNAVLTQGRCGESCIDPKDYWKYKIFEPDMKKAETNTPCADLGHGLYNQTQTHSAMGVSIDVDLYLKDK